MNRLSQRHPSAVDVERSLGFLAPDRHQIGGNFPPEPAEADEPTQEAADAEDQDVLRLIANTNAWLEAYPVIETEEVAKEATDALEQLQKHHQASETKFKEEKEPHEKELRKIRQKWHPRINRLEICIKALRPRQRAWLKLAEDRRKAKDAAAKLAAEEAQRRADQLAEQAEAGGSGAVTKMIEAEEAAQEAKRAREAAAAIPARAQVRGNLNGRTHSLRTEWRAYIVDQDLCYQHFRNHADVKALLQRLANAAARHGVRNPDLPGCWISEEQV